MGSIVRLILGWLTVALCASSLATAATAGEIQIKGQFGWLGVGTAYEVEKGHFYWVGEFSGTFFNDEGPGSPMHNSGVKCPAHNDLDFNNKKARLGGYCIVLDADGDQAYLSWQCAGAPGKCTGSFEWTGGTGKYVEISGSNTFTGVTVISHADGKASGYSIWNR